MQLGRVQLIAADEIHADSLTDQRGSHTQCVRSVVSTSKKANANGSRGAASRLLQRGVAREAHARLFQIRSGYAGLLSKAHHTLHLISGIISVTLERAAKFFLLRSLICISNLGSPKDFDRRFSDLGESPGKVLGSHPV
jgi:hypothetical protein